MNAKTSSQAVSAERTFIDPTDGQSKFYLDSSNVRFNDNITIGQLRPSKNAHHDTTLKSLLHFSELFESFPELENLYIRFSNPKTPVNYARYFMPKYDDKATRIMLNMRAIP